MNNQQGRNEREAALGLSNGEVRPRVAVLGILRYVFIRFLVAGSILYLLVWESTPLPAEPVPGQGSKWCRIAPRQHLAGHD